MASCRELSCGIGKVSYPVMAELHEIVKFLDAELKTSGIPDYPGAMNGLQLENNGTVSRVVSAVDASLAVIEAAAAGGGGLLIVHHGMFWQGAQPITGPYFRKLKTAIEGNLAIYSTHLPLDVHPTLGNNILLAQALGLSAIRPILPKDGFPMGVAGEWRGDRDALGKVIKGAVGQPARLCAGGMPEIQRVAVMTGGAGSEVSSIAALGIDTFVTGEGPHWSFIEAEERGLNVFYAGHYATETFGIKNLGSMLTQKYHLVGSFIAREGGL